MRVSLCTIAKNEEAALTGLLKDFREQNYPHNKIEVIMIDSGSTDRTHEIMEEFQQAKYGFYDIKIYNSTGKNQASAWNVAIEHATGDIIIRVDAHSKIPRQFVSRNVFNIREGENIVGGGRPNICANPNPWTMTLQAAEESLFGSSVADYRRPAAQKEYHDSLFHAAYRREVFANVGGFNEDLGRTEDNELHYRIRQAGYKMCCCPEIISFQHTRPTQMFGLPPPTIFSPSRMLLPMLLLYLPLIVYEAVCSYMGGDFYGSVIYCDFFFLLAVLSTVTTTLYSLKYFTVFTVCVDNENLMPNGVFAYSKYIMKNKTGSAAKLIFSFTPWLLLCLLILPMLYVIPYMTQSLCIAAKWMTKATFEVE